MVAIPSICPSQNHELGACFKFLLRIKSKIKESKSKFISLHLLSNNKPSSIVHPSIHPSLICIPCPPPPSLFFLVSRIPPSYFSSRKVLQSDFEIKKEAKIGSFLCLFVFLIQHHGSIKSSNASLF